MYDECNGIYENADVDGCSCHISPPCTACINSPLECSECKREAYN